MPAPYTIFDVQALPTTFQDDFSSGTLNANNWVASDYETPGSGVFDPTYVLLNQGMLCLALTQTGNNVANSVGSEIASVNSFSFGVYQWDARLSSNTTTPNGAGHAISGQVSGLFNYRTPAANTEIDFELEGHLPCQLEVGTWVTEASHALKNVYLRDLTQAFRAYSFWWTSEFVRFYVDGFLIYTNTTNVPQLPAPVLMNHWAGEGEDLSFGGPATFNVTRRLYVRSFKFWSQDQWT
jgi:beta-glucanase (GH16 family)